MTIAVADTAAVVDVLCRYPPYVALALSPDGRLITTDQRLRRAAHGIVEVA